jgi:hypothetical protein
VAPPILQRQVLDLRLRPCHGSGLVGCYLLNIRCAATRAGSAETAAPNQR